MTSVPSDRDIPHVSSVSPSEDVRTIMVHEISWGAVFAGAVMMLGAAAYLEHGWRRCRPGHDRRSRLETLRARQLCPWEQGYGGLSQG